MTGVRHASIDPDGQGSLGGILVARLEEPEEDVLMLSDIDVTGEALDTGISLTNAGGDLFVADGDVEISLGGNEIRGRSHKLGPGDGQRGHQGSNPERVVHRGQQETRWGQKALGVKKFKACSQPFLSRVSAIFLSSKREEWSNSA